MVGLVAVVIFGPQGLAEVSLGHYRNLREEETALLSELGVRWGDGM